MGIAEKIENLITEINQIVLTSNLPEKVDEKWFDDFLLECYN